MVDPGVAGDGEGIHVLAGELVVLEQVLRVAHVPPDVRVVHVRLVHGEQKQNDDLNEGEDGQEGSSGAEPSANAGTKVDWGRGRRRDRLGR